MDPPSLLEQIFSKKTPLFRVMSNFPLPGGDYKNLGDNFTWGCLSKDF